MSKLGTLVAIPLGLFAIKQLQKQFPDEKDPEPILPEGKDDTMPIVPLWPPTPVVIPPQVPSKIKIDIPEGIVPFFPETAVTAGKEFAEKKPFEFKPELFPKIPSTGLPTEFTIDWTKRPTD